MTGSCCWGEIHIFMVSVNKEQKKDKQTTGQENVYNEQTCLSRALVVTPAHREILYRAFAQKMNIRKFCAAHLRCVTSVWWATQTAPRAFCSRACEGCLKFTNDRKVGHTSCTTHTVTSRATTLWSVSSFLV